MTYFLQLKSFFSYYRESKILKKGRNVSTGWHKVEYLPFALAVALNKGMLKHRGKEDGLLRSIVIVWHLYMLDGWVKNSDERCVFQKVETFSTLGDQTKKKSNAHHLKHTLN